MEWIGCLTRNVIDRPTVMDADVDDEIESIGDS